MHSIQRKRISSHFFVVLVVITIAQGDVVTRSQWHSLEQASHGAPKVLRDTIAASVDNRQISKETERAASSHQVSKPEITNHVNQMRTEYNAHIRASDTGDIWSQRRVSSGDNVPLKSYRRSPSSEGFSPIPFQSQFRTSASLDPSGNSGMSRPSITTNLDRLWAELARPTHRVITGREGQQHIPSQGRDAVPLAAPYNQLANAFLAPPAGTHSRRQHLTSLTSQDNVENLRPSALNEFSAHISQSDPINHMQGYHPGSIAGRLQSTNRNRLHQGGHHVGQSRVTLFPRGQNSQQNAHHGQMNSRKNQNISQENVKSRHAANTSESFQKGNYSSIEHSIPRFLQNVTKEDFQRKTTQGNPEGMNYYEGNKRQLHYVDELDRDSAKESVEEPGIRISFIRQSESLNPLSVRRPTTEGRPGGLTSTALANKDHRNVSYIDLSAHNNPSGPEHTSTENPSATVPEYQDGGPVDPSQLLLQTLDARPIAPGRPPSSVIAQPSPIIPETLLGSTEAPPATLSFVRNRTVHAGNGEVLPSAIDPDTLQISGSQGGQNLGPSPFFSGAPLRPDYVYTTRRPPRPPVDPANLLIAPGFTTRPPITVPPPGYDPLLSALQQLDIVHVNDDPNPSVVDIPSPQDTLAALGDEYPWENTQVQNIPGGVPASSPSKGPLVISNNSLVEHQSTDPILNLIDNQVAFDVLDQIASQNEASVHQEERPGVPQLTSSPFTQQQHTFNIHTSIQPQHLIPNRPVSNIPQPTNNGYFASQNAAYPGDPSNSFLDIQNDNLQSHFFSEHASIPANFPNFPVPYPNVSPGFQNNPIHYPTIPAGYQHNRPGYPPSLNSQLPYGNLQFPGYGTPYNQNNPLPNPYQYPYPYPGSHAGQGQSNGEPEPSASVAASVTNKVSSADSSAEGGDGVVSTSTTITKGGSSTSNNNFYRPPPGGGQGTSAISPSGISIPPEVAPVPASTSSNRPRPPIIIDGVRNETATPSDVFPGSNVNVACSRRHGCPAFVLRSRPGVPQPEDERKNTYIFDEAVERRPSGNINIACDFQEGCPTYIINTTPDPQRVITTTSGPTTTIPPAHPPIPPPPPPPAISPQPAEFVANSSVNSGELLEAISLVLDLLNKTEGFDLGEGDGSLTGDFDYIFESAGIDGFDNLLSHTPGLAPPINPQNIRPGLQIIPSPTRTTTISPLAQHIGLQSRPNYEVVRVPENTVLNSPSLSNLLDNQRVFSVNPLLTKTADGPNELASNVLGQPGSFDLLRNRLVQAHLEALQENDLGVTSPDPLGSHVSEVGNLNDAHMGGVVATERPSLASILNLEPQNIPNEPPLVETNTHEDHGHHNMMRHIMAATFMGLPMTTALMTALGAPVALMAPLGLAIPALLTMGFMDVNSNQGNFGHHFRRPLHGHGHHGHHHHPTEASTTEVPDTGSISNGNLQGAPTTEGPSANVNTQDSRGGGRMGLGNGGGFAGALRRLGGILPMMVSNFASRMGARSGKSVRRRREVYEKFSSDSELAEGDSVDNSDTPSLLLSHGDLETLRDMSRLYSHLSAANSTEVEKPSSEEVLLHRKYLLGLLKQLQNRRQGAAKENSTSEFERDQDSTVISDDNKSLLESANSKPGTSHNETDQQNNNFIIHNTQGSVNRIGQTAPDNADIQNINAEAAALLLHQFQTQGSVNLLPPSLLGHVPPTTPPPTQLDLLFGQQPAPAPLASSSNAARPNTFSNMGQHTQDLASSAGFQGNLPQSLLSVAVQNGGAVTRPGGFDTSTGELLPPSVLLGDPSRFSDYVALANALISYDQATALPSVVMVDKLDFQEIGVADQPSSLPFNTSDLNRLQFPPVAATVQNTRITTELSTAITNFITNISDAISQFITDLQAAIDANPAVALLLLLPLLFLPFLFFKNQGGYGGGGYGGGYGHRRVYYHPEARAMMAEKLTLKILDDIAKFEKLFLPDNNKSESSLKQLT